MISIIIPTLNEEKVLKETLINLRTLLKVPHEVIVSDGKSTDGTRAIAEQYADKLVCFNEDRRQTIAEARNMGAAVASGDFYVFLDADVNIPNSTDFFNALLKRFGNEPHLVAMAVYLKVYPDEATLADALFFGLMNHIYYVMNNWLHVGAAAGEFQMMRAEAFIKVNGYNPKLVAAEDLDLFSRLAKIGNTRIGADLHILQSARRVRAVGWPMLLASWTANTIGMRVFKKAASKEWKPIR